jgi:hypothetical protein
MKRIMTEVPCAKHIKYISFCDDCRAASQKSAVLQKTDTDQHRQKFVVLQQKGQYICVKADTAQDLVIRVNEKMEDGYKPLGSPNVLIAPYTSGQGGDGNMHGIRPIIISTSVSTSYMQFMVKESK